MSAALNPTSSNASKEQTVDKKRLSTSEKTMSVREYLDKIDSIILKGLENMLTERPVNPVEYMAAYLKETDPGKKSPQTNELGPPPPLFSCGCLPGPPLPRTSCGCFLESWEIQDNLESNLEQEYTTIQAVETTNVLALP
ncbi:hypothetical protein MPTK1_Vg00045 [Marchantia polymorpha subsp. ruderalis]|nr:hypothetical protein Mp_Vg00045 [Marchantia polymorpha subsp. ruderalis]